MSVHFRTDHYPVEHWLLGLTGMPADAGPPPTFLRGRVALRGPGSPSDTGSAPASGVGPRSSVLRERPSGRLSAMPGPTSGRRAARPVRARTPVVEVGRARAVGPLENSRASTSIFVLQAIKSQRWMPWRLKPKKDVGDCDKPRGAVYQASIRGCPNGATQHPSWGVTPT
jgi:hypothetical protein